MKKYFKLLLILNFFLMIPFLCQADTVILTNTSPDATITAGSNTKVYGTASSNQIILASGAKAELMNFPGQNSIQIQVDSNLFTVFRSGAYVTFEGTDGTVLKIPATTSVQTIAFTDQTLTLSIYNNQVMLDDQVIGGGSDPISPADCTYSISPTSGSFVSSGGINSVSITASTSTCAWTASESLDWVSLSPTSGTGGGTVTITAIANTGVVRTGSIAIAGETYTVSQEGLSTNTTTDCGAYVAPGVWKEFDCYNLAAIGKTTNDDPFIPSWRLIGGYWQWGRKGPDSSQWYDTNTEYFAHGPTGPGSGEANDGAVDGWYDYYHAMGAPDGFWSDNSKTVNDPCPVGYRVPTKSQWDGVINNNILIPVGTWGSSSGYGGAWKFGIDLLLPAAGERHSSDGTLWYRGYHGRYWSSTTLGTSAWHTPTFTQDDIIDYMDEYKSRTFGFSVRCVAE